MIPFRVRWIFFDEYVNEKKKRVLCRSKLSGSASTEGCGFVAEANNSLLKQINKHKTHRTNL
jgi:hypothetical protein